MKSLAMLSAALSLVAPNVHAQGGGGTSGHGADVVLCSGSESDPNGFRGYYSWDFFQMSDPALARIEGGNAQKYVERVARILRQKLPGIGGRYHAFLDRLFKTNITRDESGVVRFWRASGRPLAPGKDPLSIQSIPEQCTVKANRIRVINRVDTGRLNFSPYVVANTSTGIYGYEYDRGVLEALAAQDGPQYSMVLFHEFLRDDRDDNDFAIWNANVLLHSDEAESMPAEELRRTLKILGFDTGETQENSDLLQQQDKVLARLREVANDLSERIIRAKSAGTDSFQAAACVVKEKIENGLRDYLASVPGSIGTLDVNFPLRSDAAVLMEVRAIYRLRSICAGKRPINDTFNMGGSGYTYPHTGQESSADFALDKLLLEANDHLADGKGCRILGEHHARILKGIVTDDLSALSEVEQLVARNPIHAYALVGRYYEYCTKIGTAKDTGYVPSFLYSLTGNPEITTLSGLDGL